MKEIGATMISRTALALLVLSFFVSTAVAQPIPTLTPQLVEEAIKLGADARAASRFLARYKLQKRSGWGNEPVVAVFSTPFSRVVEAALDAHKKYQPFTAAQVTPALIAAEIWVVAPARRAFTASTEAPKIASVTAIALMPARSKDRSQAIQPLRQEEDIARFTNLFGAEFDGTGMLAVFPLTSFVTGYDLHVVFDATVEGGGLNSCSDCAVPIEWSRDIK